MLEKSKKPKNYLPIVIVGLLFLIGLAIFLGLDLMVALSVYLKFTLLYTTFWLVLGAILLRRQPRPHQLLMLTLFLAAIVTLYSINWDSRKAFLKDFRQIEVGMAAAQAEQALQQYIKFVGPASQINEQGEIVEGTISYQHTQEGWGDADIGLIVIENSRVAQTEFHPDWTRDGS